MRNQDSGFDVRDITEMPLKFHWSHLMLVMAYTNTVVNISLTSIVVLASFGLFPGSPMCF